MKSTLSLPGFELQVRYVSISSMKSVRISNAEGGTETIERPSIEQETRSEEELDSPWLVVVHNDPVNLMTYVTMVFQRVFGYPREKAERHMLEVHEKGRSILWGGMRERAELYVQQLHGYLLLATIEKAS
jgi:ATP-dependent Clp protease adaptor protein ClpS